ncbi:MAG TPA: o-succinylbenzoate synthase [Terriglobales bacterium]|nr:o-succinylbenzoate synthase [Terriglobales bacterium]
MKIDFVALRELKMRLKAPFETSFGTTFERRVLLVEVGADGLSGWAEITTQEEPFYNAETTETSWHIFSDYIIPMVLGKTVNHASEIPALLCAIRGNEMARAGIENALWDVEAQEAGIPLSKLLGGTRTEIASGVSLGIQSDTTVLLDNIEKELSAGYQRIKLKIKPGMDIEVVRRVRAHFPDILLMVDANSAYRPADAPLLQELDAFNLMMIEQPLNWDDIYLHAQLQRQLRTPICLDECIHNSRHARAAIELGACGVINVKLGRVGGHSEARAVHDVCLERKIPVWCGGMLESGIGRAHNVAMSSLPGFVLPGDVSGSKRYWEQDIIDPEVVVTSRGMIPVPKSPGLGYAIRQELVRQLTVRERSWHATSVLTAGATLEAH